MILTLRQAIMKRVANKTNEELESMIVDSIDGDERALPGIGVLFEVIWKNSAEADKKQLVQLLSEHLEPAAEVDHKV